MKIVRKSRKIKSRYIGFVYDEFYLPARNKTVEEKIDNIIIINALTGIGFRIYSDEVPLPDYLFLTRRSSYFLEKQSTWLAGLWHGLSLNKLKFS